MSDDVLEKKILGGTVRRVEIGDMMDYRFISSPAFSPDGSTIAIRVHRGDFEGDRYDSRIWLCDSASGETRELTSSGADGVFCWSLDGREIFFVSDRDADGCAPKMSKLYRVRVDGGEARFVASCERTITELWALPNDHLLVRTVDPREEKREMGADYMIFEQIPFNSNGRGYTAQRRSRLSLFFPSDGKLSDITPETFEVSKVRVADDGSSAIFTATDYSDVMPRARGVWRADLTKGTIVELVPQDRARWECAAPFAGGLLMIGTYSEKHGINENRQFFIRKEDGSIRSITPDFDRSLHNSVGCDCRYGIGDVGEGLWVDSDRAWFVKTERYRSVLCTVDASGVITEITKELSSVDDLDVFKGRAAVVGLKDLSLQELYIVDAASERKLTSFNVQILDGVALSRPEHARIDNGTEWGLDCWSMKPIGYEPGKKYPTILEIHGGPKGVFGDVFFHEMQLLAGAGYAVIYCNPRGSDGLGNAYSDIRGKYGTIDYEDVMACVDWAVRELPFVDEGRLGVTGGSYGGFMTNWIVGHTDRFRAAATQRSICNWTSKLGMSDIGYYFVPDQNAGEIDEDITPLWDRSPLKFAKHFKTPTLVIHSDADFRCELGQGLQMFTALKLAGVPTKMCVFKGENHELSRSGRPKARLARLAEILKWFKKYL